MTHRFLSQISVNAIVLIVLIAVLILVASIVPGAALTAGYQVIRQTTEMSGEDFQELTVTCPEDMKAIGGGAGIFYSNSDDVQLLPRLISSFSYPDDRSWFAEGVQPAEADATWRLEVHVTCVSASSVNTLPQNEPSLKLP